MHKLSFYLSSKILTTSIAPFANPSYLSYCNLVWGSGYKLFEAYLKRIVIW